MIGTTISHYKILEKLRHSAKKPAEKKNRKAGGQVGEGRPTPGSSITISRVLQ